MLKGVIAGMGLAVVLGVSSVYGATVTMDFDDDLVDGGNLQDVSGNSLTWDDFNDETSYTFQIADIESAGSVEITATARGTDLSFFADGLGDGTGGYDAAGEGTDFTFERAVTITKMDWYRFTSDGNDSVQLLLDEDSLGTFGQDDESGGIDFTNTNPATMSVEVPAGSTFSLEHKGGDFKLERLTFTIPEPGVASLIILGGTALLCRRRR